jgi:hypothetical protein
MTLLGALDGGTNSETKCFLNQITVDGTKLVVFVEAKFQLNPFEN